MSNSGRTGAGIAHPVPVLLVEDDAAHAELARRAFEDAAERFEVSVASSVEEALRCIDERRPQVVVSDWRLPDGHGTDLVRAKAKQIPIVVMTSHGDEQTAVAVMKAGAIDYVVKSESCFEELPHVVERALRDWQLMVERSQSRARLQAQYDCVTRLAGASTLDEAILPVLLEAGTRLGAVAAEFWVPQGSGELRRQCAWHRGRNEAPQEESPRTSRIGEGWLGEAWRRGEASYLTSSELDAHHPTPPGAQSGCAFPIAKDGRGSALIAFFGAQPEWATDPDVGHFVRALASQLSVFVERCRLQEELMEGERLAALGTAAAVFAHEVGNPLNTMYLQAQLLQRRLDAPESGERVRKGLGGILGEIRRLNTLLKEFRALSRKRPLQLSDVDLSELLRELLDAHVPRDTLIVDVDLPEDLPSVRADRDKLTQVFLNLCKNAVEAMPQGGTLSVRARVDERALVIDIQDTGVGLPPGVDIFELFKTTKPQGTGLGLPVVRQIVAAHGGTVAAQSRPSDGAQFTVSLPLAS